MGKNSQGVFVESDFAGALVLVAQGVTSQVLFQVQIGEEMSVARPATNQLFDAVADMSDKHWVNGFSQIANETLWTREPAWTGEPNET